MKDHLLRLSSILLILALATTGCIFGSSDDDPVEDDPIVPEVASIDPADGEIHVNTWEDVEIRFSVDMDPTSVENATSVTSPSRAAVAFETSWYGQVLELEFDEELDAETPYTVTIGVGATSAEGEPLAAAFSSTFTTLPTSPVVLSTFPEDGATDVSLNAQPWVEFSTWMNATSVEDAISVDPADSYTLVNNGEQFTLQFDADLSASTLYTVTVAGTAESGWGGELMGEDHEFSFTTGTGIDDTPPSIVSFDPPNGAVGVSRDIGQITITFSEPIQDLNEPEGMDLRLYGLFLGDPDMDPGDTMITIPLYRLPAGCEFWVDLGPFMDMVGNESANPPVYSFTTAGTAELFPSGEGDWWIYWRDEGMHDDDYMIQVENVSGSTFDMSRYRPDYGGGRDLEDYTVLDEIGHYSRSTSVLSWLGNSSEDEGVWEEESFTPPIEWLHFPLSTGTEWSGNSEFDMDGEAVRVAYSGEVLAVADWVPESPAVRADRGGWLAGRAEEDGYNAFPDCAEVELNFTVEAEIEGSWEVVQEGTETSYYCPGLGLVYRHAVSTEYGDGDPEVREEHTALDWWLVGQ